MTCRAQPAARDLRRQVHAHIGARPLFRRCEGADPAQFAGEAFVRDLGAMGNVDMGRFVMGRLVIGRLVMGRLRTQPVSP